MLNSTHSFSETLEEAQKKFNEGKALNSQRKPDEALSKFKAALPLATQIYGIEHQFVGEIKQQIGGIYISKREHALALTELTQALEIYTKICNKHICNKSKELGHDFIASIWGIIYAKRSIGIVYSSKGEYEKAKEIFKDAIKTVKYFFGEGHRFEPLLLEEIEQEDLRIAKRAEALFSTSFANLSLTTNQFLSTSSLPSSNSENSDGDMEAAIALSILCLQRHSTSSKGDQGEEKKEQIR